MEAICATRSKSKEWFLLCTVPCVSFYSHTKAETRHSPPSRKHGATRIPDRTATNRTRNDLRTWGHPCLTLTTRPTSVGLLRENYPCVRTATFRFNAFFAHQAPILYYKFIKFAISNIDEIFNLFLSISIQYTQFWVILAQNTSQIEV